MNAQNEQRLVLRMRREAAEILRKHDEATSRAGTAYRLATRQIDVFRESLQQTAKGMAGLTGAVRGASADIADNPALMAWVTAGSGEPARDPEMIRDVVPQRIVRSIEDELFAVRQSRGLDQVDETDWDRRRIVATGRRSPAADDRDSTETRDFRDHRAPAGQDFYGGLREGRALAAAFDLPDLTAASELKAAIDATLRNQAPLMRTGPHASLGPAAMGMRGSAIEYRPSENPIDPKMSEGKTRGPRPAVLSGNATSSIELSPGYPTRGSLERAAFDASSFATAIAVERREAMAEIHGYVTSLSREVTGAITQLRARPEIEDGRKDEELLLERLTLELKRLLPPGGQIEEVAADRGTWSRENRVPGVETVVSRRPPTTMVPEWIGAASPGGDSIGAQLRDATAGWQAYGSGIAKALGTTDQALAGILTQTRDWRSAMHGLINSVVADFARIAIRQTITGPLSDVMFGGDRRAGDAGLLGRAFGWITSLFEGGGVMTSHGPLPLRTYASGGIAASPQLALFGEGSTPEAYVPVPNGRIPVTLRGGAPGPGIGSIATNIVINVAGGGVAGGTVAAPDSAEQARNIGAMVSAAFNRNLAEQMRPGGLLNPSGYLGSGLAH
jgi:hypothetical protein